MGVPSLHIVLDRPAALVVEVVAVLEKLVTHLRTHFVIQIRSRYPQEAGGIPTLKAVQGRP